MKLAGVRVLDMSSFIPGPYLSLIMADHGANVLKVEAPGTGDPSREIGISDGPHTVWFRNFNRGKRSIVLNLKDDGDLSIFYQLAKTADVIIESSRPGVAARLKVDYDTVRQSNPRIIYCSISAFGQDGPYSHHPAHDLAVEGYGGLLSANIDRDSRPTIPGMPNADILAGLHGLSAVLMALYAREHTSLGDYIDISMLESLMSGMLNIWGSALSEDRQPIIKHQRSTGGTAFYQIYDTSDGRHIVLGGQEMKFVNILLTALGRADLAPLCAQGPGPHQQPVVDLLKAHFSKMSLAEASAFLEKLDICWAPVNNLVEALNDPQLASRSFIIRDSEGRRHIGPVARFRHDPAIPSLASPTLDEQGELIKTNKGTYENGWSY